MRISDPDALDEVTDWTAILNHTIDATGKDSGISVEEFVENAKEIIRESPMDLTNRDRVDMRSSIRLRIKGGTAKMWFPGSGSTSDAFFLRKTPDGWTFVGWPGLN